MHPLQQGLPLSFPLWGKTIPFSGEALPGLPRMTVYLSSPEYRSGKMILICPGGAYMGLALSKEGHRIARYISSHGHAAAVLEYRYAPYRYPVPLIDVQRALRMLRHHAGDWGCDPWQIGILGFSAGGHLAACAATLPMVEEGLTDDAIDRHPHRPDFAILVYPVISFVHDAAHSGSRKALLGDTPDEALSKKLSLENAVSPDTPPILLIHTDEDEGVPAENSLVFYQSLRKHHIPSELHIYEKGVHGIGLANNHPWGHALLSWLENRQ